MNTFEKILIAVDESNYSYNAAKYGFELAHKLNASIALVHINQIPMVMNVTGDPILGNAGVVLPNVMDIQSEAAEKLVADIISNYGAGKKVEQFILTGDVRDEIIMGTHGRTGFNHFISGSIAEDVIKLAKCPVLIVPNKQD
jgi:nucleotide-binding universal stress UspA family protein